MVTAFDLAEKRRDSAKTTLEWLVTKLASHALVPLNQNSVNLYLQMTTEAHERAKDSHEKIVGYAPADIGPHNAEFFMIIDMVPGLIEGFEAIKATFAPPVIVHPTPGSSGAVGGSDIKLPVLKLPEFNGNIQNWASFRDMFAAAVDSNPKLTKAQKLAYLKSSLTGDAVRQVSSLPVTDDNYDIAWSQLTHRYDNKRELLFTVLQRFTGAPILSGNSAAALRSHIDVSKECIHSLSSLQLPVDQWDAILLYHIATKLDRTTREMWEQTLVDSDIPPLKDFLEFLEQRARALATGRNSQAQPVSAQGGRNTTGNRVAHAHHVPSTTCTLCTGNHPLSKCSRFGTMTIPERFETAKKSSLCYNCLREGHSIANCTSRGTCRTCQGKHHTLLHRERPVAETSREQGSLQLGHHASNPGATQGMLATALIKVKDHHGQFHLCRAFLDGGSTASFITESCVRRLNLPRTRSSAEIRGLASTAVGTARGIASLSFSSQHTGNPSYSIEALILPKVTARLPVHPCDPNVWPHLRGLPLADPQFFKPDNIDILLGADIFYTSLMNETRAGPPGCPIAIKTTLGWIVAGEMSSQPTPVIVNYGDVDMEKQLNKLWEIETVSSSRALTKEEQDCETHFESTHQVNEQGRFIVRLPLRNPNLTLGSSREMAIRQFKQLEGRLTRAPERYQQYRDFMSEYLALGHMEEIPASEVLAPLAPTCYIPHHFVCKESSTTTKLRVVFNASCKTTNGLSLNDILMVGPALQDHLADILMRFRTHPIAFTADVAKMYRQILVSKPENDLQRIVWRDSGKESIKDYRLLTVTYGTGPASFLATRALQQLASNHSETLPLASKAALRDMFVDDLMTGSETLEVAHEIVSQLLKLMNNGGMELRKWSSNCSALLQLIPPELCETQALLPLDADQTIKTLGVYWDPVRDQCSFKVTIDVTIQGNKLTKRNVLSEISKVFDPLGWLAPVIIKARIMIQDLLKLQLGWDEQLPTQFQQEWIEYRDSLHHIEELTIPRCIKPSGYLRKYLAGFCDASEKAYAAVVYLCVYEHGRESVISLISSKVRVAPARPVSLPRLELCGAVLLSQLVSNVQRNLEIDTANITTWTDSTVVLAWIQSHPSRWKTFVANRVTEIQDRVPACHWRHVSGPENPADCASRGLSPPELKSHPLWWNGPVWIRTEGFGSDSQLNLIGEDEAVKMEEKSGVLCSHAIQEENSLSRSYSSLWKLKRVTALLLRFYNNCLISAQGRRRIYPLQQLSYGPLTPNELDAALLTWVRITQAEQFPREILALQKGETLSPKSPLHPLCPFIDSNNLLRVGGRLRNAPLPINQRQPLLLPRHHHLTKLLIMSEHEKNLHAGPQLLLSIIHRRFWIIRARDAIRHQINKCVVCTRAKGVTMQQFMGDFPSSRVTPNRPFLKCGVDYAGPFLIKPISPRSKLTIKAYMAIFVCFSTHAVHLEVVSALSTAAFIAAMHRFISRRGKPSDVYSDCGTNFTGAAREIKEATDLLNSTHHNQSVAERLAGDGIQWHFNPPGAPHFGGLWEAGVKSVKYHLKRVVGLARLTYEELATVITQIEACLNSRPLTPLSTDPNDFSVLTPGHFLIGAPLTALPEIDLTEEKTGRLSRWQQVQKLHQHFWHRWSNEFIARMQQRPKWLTKRHDLKIGDLVIIKDDRLPPLKWQLGRVTLLHPGADGLVRVVTLWTSSGQMKRPIVKLCLLPIDSKPLETESA